ncbi:helix-turn-helix domain-containing protein [Thalassoglobus sp. JC818]|uniref:helix-turn-helix domain-containing protein n=1 Tax=Thalassoglobus sp. JC818 TaxID=3232136 RepID=UPI00345844AF
MHQSENSCLEDLLVTPRQAANLLSISERTLWGMTKRCDLPHIRIWRSVRYSVEDLRDWIARQRVGGEG